MSEKSSKQHFLPYAVTERDLDERGDGSTPGSTPGQCCGRNPHNARAGQIRPGQVQLPTPTGMQEVEMSEEARNQLGTAAQSRAASGTP
jgi:hypothetical protein